MLRSTKDLIGYPVKALDGNMGKVVDCLIDEKHWHLRHLVVDTGHHLKLNFHYLSEEETDTIHRRVVVDPGYLDSPETGRFRRHLPVKLTKESIMHCPGIETDPPKSLEYKEEFTKFYRHIPYSFYDRPAIWTPSSDVYGPPDTNIEHTPEELEEHHKRLQEIAHNHTQSCKEILGYHIECTDCELGLVDDLIVNDNNWRIIAMAIRYGHWPHANHRLFSIRHVTGINWSESKVMVNFSSEEIERVPVFNPHAPVNHGDDNEDYDYYGKPTSGKIEIR